MLKESGDIDSVDIRKNSSSMIESFTSDEGTYSSPTKTKEISPFTEEIKECSFTEEIKESKEISEINYNNKNSLTQNVSSTRKKSKFTHVHLPEDRIRYYLTMYGDRAFSYMILDPTLCHYELAGIGLIGYCRVRTLLGNVAVVICDPLCSRENMKGFLHNFELHMQDLIQYA